MEFIHGVKINDIDKLKTMGVSLAEVKSCEKERERGEGRENGCRRQKKRRRREKAEHRREKSHLVFILLIRY